MEIQMGNLEESKISEILNKKSKTEKYQVEMRNEISQIQETSFYLFFFFLLLRLFLCIYMRKWSLYSVLHMVDEWLVGWDFIFICGL